MDIPCPTCGEPYEEFHLVNHEIHSTGLKEDERKAFTGDLDPQSKEALEIIGWEFYGPHITKFTRCPCCPKAGILRQRVEQMRETH